MFENEIKETKEKLINTLLNFRKFKKIQRKQEKMHKNNQVYYFDTGALYTTSIYDYASSKLLGDINSMLGFRKLQENCRNKKSFKTNIKLIEKITLEDVLSEFKRVTQGTSYNGKKTTIADDTINLNLSDYHLKLVLNAINILKNNELETQEIYKKCREVLKTDNTFIYRDVKITVYKNGKTKLVFADNKLKNKMIEVLNNKSVD